MARLPRPGQDANVWGQLLNDYLAVEHTNDGRLRRSALIDGAEQSANKGQPGGYVPLQSDGKIHPVHLPALTKAMVGLGDVDNTADADKPVPTAVQTALQGKIDASGGTFTGDVMFDGSSSRKQLHLISSNAGGENDFDSTSRVTLQSYQRWQKHASDGTTEAHFGELVRMQLMKDNAKAVVSWQDRFTNPDKPYTVAGIVGHYMPNDPNTPVHGHVSIEVVDSNLLVQTRFEVRFVDEAGNIGVDQCLIKTSDARFVVDCQNGASYVAGANGAYKNLYFSNDTHGQQAGNRWSLQQDITTESGANVGSDFRLNRYSDTGTFLESALFIRRSTGQVGIGGVTSPSAKLDVSAAGSYHTIEATQTSATATNYAAFAGVLGNTGSRYLDFRLNGEANARLVAFGDGKLEWGSGSGARDANLYRSAAATLKTDDNFAVGGALTVGGQQIMGGVFAKKAADQVVTNSNALAADADLTASVVAGGVYEVLLLAVYDASTTADMKIGFSAPSGSTFDYVTGSLDASAGSAVTSVKMSWQNLSGTPSVGGVGVGAKAVLRLHGILVVGAQPGTFGWQWAQNTAEATNLTVYKNSFLRLNRVA